MSTFKIFIFPFTHRWEPTVDHAPIPSTQHLWENLQRNPILCGTEVQIFWDGQNWKLITTRGSQEPVSLTWGTNNISS